MKPEGYEESTININGTDIPSYTSNITKFTIVGIKDEKGNIKYAIYEKDNYKLSNNSSVKLLEESKIASSLNLRSSY